MLAVNKRWSESLEECRASANEACGHDRHKPDGARSVRDLIQQDGFAYDPRIFCLSVPFLGSYEMPLLNEARRAKGKLHEPLPLVVFGAWRIQESVALMS